MTTLPPQPPQPPQPPLSPQPPLPQPVDWNWWPQFHDPSLRLSWREQVCIHWDANLCMLRDWSACGKFFGISVLPFPLLVTALLIAQGGLPSVNGIPSSVNGWFYVGMVVLVVYLYVQHVAFMVAMRGYLPFVRAALSARGYPTCLACGHLLGPLDPLGAPRACPECGSGNSPPR